MWVLMAIRVRSWRLRWHTASVPMTPTTVQPSRSQLFASASPLMSQRRALHMNLAEYMVNAVKTKNCKMSPTISTFWAVGFVRRVEPMALRISQVTLMLAQIAETHLTGTPIFSWLRLSVGVTHHIIRVKVKMSPIATSDSGMAVASTCAANAVRLVTWSVESVRAIMPAASRTAACGIKLKYQALLRMSCADKMKPAIRKEIEPTTAMENDGA